MTTGGDGDIFDPGPVRPVGQGSRRQDVIDPPPPIPLQGVGDAVIPECVMAAFGMVLGLPLAYLMYRAVQQALNLFEGQMGFASAGWVALAQAGAAVLSTLLPAAKASSVEPVTAMRED